MTDPRQTIEGNLESRRHDSEALLNSDCIDQIVELALRITEALRAGNKPIFFGNGGSSMDAGHLAAELLGHFMIDRPSLPSVSLPDSTAAMTAIGNDYGYAEVFARQVRGLGRHGDVAVGLTTSGNSANVVAALVAARELGMYAVALTGESGGKVADVADLCIKVPSASTPRIQEMCMHLGHTLCEIVEREMFPQN